MALKPSERDELLVGLHTTITEVKTAVVGIAGTDERGMAGDIKEIKDTLKKQNGRIARNRNGLIALTAFLCGLGVLEWQDVIHIFGG